MASSYFPRWKYVTPSPVSTVTESGCRPEHFSYASRAFQKLSWSKKRAGRFRRTSSHCPVLLDGLRKLLGRGLGVSEIQLNFPEQVVIIRGVLRGEAFDSVERRQSFR